MTAPRCSSCDTDARLTRGREVYAHRPDLHDKWIWKCDGCGGYVGCHPGTTDALGTPAGKALRSARSILHDQMIDPLWMSADSCGLYHPEDDLARRKIRNAARGRVYAYLAAKLGIPKDDCHIGAFNIDTCRRAWVALRGVTYPEVRDWWTQHDREKQP